MTNVDVYRAVFQLKRAQVFAVSMKNFEYQAEKKLYKKPI